MRSDPKFGTRAKTFRLWTTTVLSGVLAALLVLGGCTSWQVPRAHGDPCTTHGKTWSDSLARCVPRDSTEVQR